MATLSAGGPIGAAPVFLNPEGFTSTWGPTQLHVQERLNISDKAGRLHLFVAALETGLEGPPRWKREPAGTAAPTGPARPKSDGHQG